MTPPVPRLGRVLDLVGALLFLGGAAVYGWAWMGLRRLRDDPPVSAEGAFVAVARANDFSTLSRLGLALMAGGAVVAVLAAVVARRNRDDPS